MTIRRITQITAGVLAGAVIVGVPTWAAASQHDDDARSRSDTATMKSDPQSQRQMMSSMSEMMKDREMRKQMRSMMSETMAEMPGMGDKMSENGRSGTGQMHGTGQGSKSDSPTNK